MATTSHGHIALTEQFSAHNYSPLEVVVSSAEGVWVTDVEGERYLDMLSAYSALNFGHCNPRINSVAKTQIDKLTLTSRAFYNDQLGPVCEKLANLCKLDQALLMNSGAEAVETAIKMARRWGYEVKGVPESAAEIIAFSNNFHGRTTTIISMSSAAESRHNFGPLTPGFKLVPFDDLEALESALCSNAVAIMLEPIQGEGGVIIPKHGYLRAIRELCTKYNVLMIADEIQTGLCRTGEIFACDHEGVQPDAYILGKSLGGGILPVSAVVARKECMQVFIPGSHGSTFGGNPLACAVAAEVIDIIRETSPHRQAAEHGNWFVKQLQELASPMVKEVRGRGLMIGIDIHPQYGPAKKVCLELMNHGLLCKDTRKQTIRLAPPLTIERTELEWALERIGKVLAPKVGANEVRAAQRALSEP